jgi:hypothetical protein
MFGHAFTDLEGQVEAREAGIALLEFLDDPQRMNVVIEALAETAHLPVQFLFARVSKRWMTDVMDQGQGFGEIFVKTQNRRHGARDLGHLDGMSQPVSEMVGEAGREDLSLGFQTPKGARMNNAIAIALESGAVGMLGFGIAASEAARNGKTQALEHE